MTGLGKLIGASFSVRALSAVSVSPVRVSLSLVTKAMSPALTSGILSPALPRGTERLPIFSGWDLLEFQEGASAAIEPETTRK